MPGGMAPDGQPYPNARDQALGLCDVAALAGPTGLINARASVSSQRHRHTFGSALERDSRHLVREAAYTLSADAVLVLAMLASHMTTDVDGFTSFTRPVERS
jgi:hypothetical protein